MTKFAVEVATIPMTQAYMSKVMNEDPSLSLILRVLFTLNSFYEAKQSTKLIMWK